MAILMIHSQKDGTETEYRPDKTILFMTDVYWTNL